MTRFERIYRNRSGTVLVAVLHGAEEYHVVEWEPGASEDRLIEIARFTYGSGQRQGDARELAIESAQSAIRG